MKRLYLSGLLAVVVACQGGSKTADPGTGSGSVDAAYKADIEALCDVLNRSGTADADPGERSMKIATWLGTNLKTQDARKFLSKIRPLQGAGKADALDAEGRRVGLTTCALSAEWRKYPDKR